MDWLAEIVAGFDDRMSNIAVFQPILELEQKTRYTYHLPTLGVAAMLFILEDMLRGEKNCTYENIAYFLRDVIERQYRDKLPYEEALNFAYFLVRDCLMNQGRPHVFTYIDLETGKEKSHRFHLVELEEYNIKDKEVRLKLSTSGLEMLFKTKEMYNELQVSITQLYLRQQIQKGVFDGALRSVEELSLAVKNEKARIRQLADKIMRDVRQVAREQELEKQMERVNQQLEREKKVFDELKELIEYTMEEFHSGTITDKEELAIEKIMKIRRRLLDVISQHESLFTDKIRIQKLMNSSVEAMILNAFSTRVNFETEFLIPAVRNNADISILKSLLNPLMPVRAGKSFNPGRVFEGQALRKREDDEVTEQELWELQEEEQRRAEEAEGFLREARERRLEEYFLLLLKPILLREEVSISAILDQLRKDDAGVYNELINRLDFYPFLVQLHQMGGIPLLAGWETEGMILDDLPRVLVKIAAEHKDIFDLKGFELLAAGEIIHLPNGYVMSDFTVKRRVTDGMAG